MFSGGIGQLEGSHITKEMPKKGLLTYHKENNYFIFISLYYVSPEGLGDIMFFPGHLSVCHELCLHCNLKTP